MHYNSIIVVIIVKMIFIRSFLLCCLLYNHSFKTNPNSTTNLSKLCQLTFAQCVRLFLIHFSRWPWFVKVKPYPSTLVEKLNRYINGYMNSKIVTDWNLKEEKGGVKSLVNSLSCMISLNVKERKNARQMMEMRGLMESKKIFKSSPPVR